MERDEQAVRATHRLEQFGEIGTALLSLGLWGYVWYVVSGFPDAAQRFPRFVLVCLFGFSIIHLTKACWLLLRPPTPARAEQESAARKPPAATERPAERRPLRLYLLIAGSVAYVSLLPRIGFVVTTVAFLIIGVCASIGWSVKKVVVIAAGVVVLYVVVDVLLNVPLPSGILL